MGITISICRALDVGWIVRSVEWGGWEGRKADSADNGGETASGRQQEEAAPRGQGADQDERTAGGG